MIPEAVRTYLLHDLEAAPLALARILAPNATFPSMIEAFETELDFDARPDPQRFTLREMVAHLADWEDIWLERVERMVTEENPLLRSVDEGAMAEERNYADQSVGKNLARYKEGRDRLIAKLRSLPADAWERKAHREFVGDLDLLQLVAMIAGHDGYHLKQALGV